MVRHLAGAGYASAGVYKYVPPVFDADASTPRYRMNCLEDWGYCDLETHLVPIPDIASPSLGSDRNMVVIDWSTRRVFEFYKYSDDRRTVKWGAVIPLDGSGTGNGVRDPGRYGAVGAGVSRLAGVIRTFEIHSGIEHALVGASGFSCKDNFRYPAVKTDGWSADHGCLPQGARVQLDPSIVCTRLPDIEPWEILICKAMQKYGWYNIDNGRVGEPGFSVQFEAPIGEFNPYPSVGLVRDATVNSIPLDRLRVLAQWNSHE